jgi:hypothetical protein
MNSITNESLLTKEFLKSLDEQPMNSYLIARSHLGNSFDLEKSVAYLRWIKTRPLPTAICADVPNTSL